MRACVVSDIHGNLHALEAVLEAIDAEAPDEVWCLGDLVGYGPRPNECCRLVAERADVCLVGNHDLAVLGKIDIDVFTHDAGVSARWTREVLEDDARAFLGELEPAGSRADAALFHASPRDPVWEYVLSIEVADQCLRQVDGNLVLVGHSHFALAFWLTGGGTEGGLAPNGSNVDLAPADAWLLNPGSVGQPRDGDPRASFLVLDTDERWARFRRVPYDIAATQAEIRELGLPHSLADRLTDGL
jgi:diadenosine tetraphosphatase ApaH/serine/threonine PP2A family protein phosphatase